MHCWLSRRYYRTDFYRFLHVILHASRRFGIFYPMFPEIWVATFLRKLRETTTELYYMTGESAPHYFLAKSEAKNMADFSFCSRQIDATGPYFSWYLPLSNRDPSLRRSFHPPVFSTKS